MHLHDDQGRLSGAIEEVERRRWLFDNLPLDPLHRDWLRRRATVRSIAGSVRIGGHRTTLSDFQVGRLLDGVGEKALEAADVLAIRRLRDALELVDALAARDAGIDEDLIGRLQHALEAGQDERPAPAYRSTESRITGPTNEILYTAPPPADVPGRMRTFVSWLAAHAEISIPVLAALTHLELVAIHPFASGNGRTARAAARLVLVRGGYGLGGLVSLEAYLDAHRDAYAGAIRDSLGTAYAPGYDATPFVVFLLEAMASACDEVLERLRGLGELQARVRLDVLDGSLPPSMTDALAYAFIGRSIRAGDYREVTGRTAPTTTRDLASAVRTGYLVPVGVTRDRWYRLGPRLLEVASRGEPGDPREPFVAATRILSATEPGPAALATDRRDP